MIRLAMKKFERIAGAAALVLIVAAWLIGAMRPGPDITASLKLALPRADEFKPFGDAIFAGHGPGLVGYATTAEADGYGGPILVTVAVDTDGKLTGACIVEQKETPAFFDRIKADRYIASLVGKACSERFSPGDDIDAISGATVSLEALTTAIRRGAAKLGGEALGLPVDPPEDKNVEFGGPEIILIVLFSAGLLAVSKPLARRPRTREALRWTTRLGGLILIGFVLTAPLSIVNIHSLLTGYTPDWRTNIYWYLLIVGAFGPLIFAGKDTYCQCICPFGAAQDILKLVGGTKRAGLPKWSTILRWIQRLAALAGIVAALLFRNPSRFSYEVFGTFFTLGGTVLQFAILGIVLVMSLFVLRPWCNFICPLRAVADFARMLRAWCKNALPKRA